MIGQAKDSVDANFTLPKALDQNKVMWARVMYHNKKVQEALSQFTTKIKDILDTEIRTKKNTINKYLKQIRPVDASLDNAERFMNKLKQETTKGFFKNEDNLYQDLDDSKKVRPLKDLLRSLTNEPIGKGKGNNRYGENINEGKRPESPDK